MRSAPSADGTLSAANIGEHIERDLVFAGLIGMIDPPRDEAQTPSPGRRRAGIRPIMITGDHPKTAAVIAHELGIANDGRAVTGAELERMSDDALDATVRIGLRLRARQSRAQAADRAGAAAHGRASSR